MQEQESENEGKKRNTKNFQTMKNDEPENQNIQYLLIYYITKSLESGNIIGIKSPFLYYN